MGDIQSAQPVLPLLAVTSHHSEAFAWASERASQAWGQIALASAQFAFNQTDYYRESMGDQLLKQFFTFSPLADPGQLPTMKIQSNQWEDEFRASGTWPEQRPINLDPGYISEGKLVLASTKNHSHRIYVGQGIYAEVTLYYRAKAWQLHPWTYPDYQSEDYHAFFSECRQLVRDARRSKLRPESGL